MNKKPNKDISFIKKDIKKLDLDYQRQNIGRPLEQLLIDMPPMGVCWILEVPYVGGREAYYVSANRPELTMNSNFDLGPYGYEQPMAYHGRREWGELYVEFRNWAEGRRLTDWFKYVMDGRDGRVTPYKKNMTLTLMDRGGVIEKWHLVGCIPTEIRYHQDGAWNDPTDVTCGVSFHIDHANIEIPT
jgi:hypothetical protein